MKRYYDMFQSRIPSICSHVGSVYNTASIQPPTDPEVSGSQLTPSFDMLSVQTVQKGVSTMFLRSTAGTRLRAREGSCTCPLDKILRVCIVTLLRDSELQQDQIALFVPGAQG